MIPHLQHLLGGEGVRGGVIKGSMKVGVGWGGGGYQGGMKCRAECAITACSMAASAKRQVSVQLMTSAGVCSAFGHHPLCQPAVHGADMLSCRHGIVASHTCDRLVLLLLQSAVEVATELQKQRADMEQQVRQMSQWLEAEKQQAVQCVNGALQQKDAECEKMIRDACSQAQR